MTLPADCTPFPPKTDWAFDEMQRLGLYKDAIIADPLFADPKNGDFTPAEDSPIFGMGFEAIDYSAAGIRNRETAG